MANVQGVHKKARTEGGIGYIEKGTTNVDSKVRKVRITVSP